MADARAVNDLYLPAWGKGTAARQHRNRCDLYLPAWGKVIHEALTGGVLQDHYCQLLEPVALLMVTGLAFAMLGYSPGRIFNPRLRSMQPGQQ